MSKVKDLALILSISVFSLSSLHLLSKTILSNRFPTLFLLTHNRLMRCSFSVVNPVTVAALLLTWFLHHCWQRIFNENTNYFQVCYIQHSHIYAVWNFHLNWLTFLEAMTDVLGVHFLSGHSVYQNCASVRWRVIIKRQEYECQTNTDLKTDQQGHLKTRNTFTSNVQDWLYCRDNHFAGFHDRTQRNQDSRSETNYKNGIRTY